MDLEAAGRRLVAHQPAPTPLVQLRRRSAIRRRRRVAAGAATVALLVAAGVGVAVSRDRHRTVSVITPSPTGPVALRSPEALALTDHGELLIDNLGSDQVLVRPPAGGLRVLAGTGRPGFGGDGGPARRAALNRPGDVAVSRNGTVYIADTGNNRIRSVDSRGIIRTIAGDGARRGPTAGPAVRTAVAQPTSVAVAASGRVYLTDGAGLQVLAGGHLTTLRPAGPGRPTAWLPDQVAVSSAGDLFVADSSPKLLVELRPDGQVLHTWTAEVSQLAAGPDSTMLVADSGRFAVDRIANGRLGPVVSFHRHTISDLRGVFRPSGVAVGVGGTVYLDTDGVNGGATTPALVRIRRDGHPGLLSP